MARRGSQRSRASSSRGRTRPVRQPWLSPQRKNELRGIGFWVLGLIAFLSLLSSVGGWRFAGSLGERLSGGLTLVVGKPVAFGLPVLLLWWGWLAFRGRHPGHSWVKYGGAVVLILACSALLGLTTRHLDKVACLEWSGILGVSLVYDAPLALNLPRYLGMAGSTVLFVAAAMAGLLLATDVLYTDVARRTLRMLGVALRGLWLLLATVWRHLRVWLLPPPREDEEEDAKTRRSAAPRTTARVLNPIAAMPEGTLGPPPRPVIVDHDALPPPAPSRPKRKPAPSPPKEEKGTEPVQAELDLRHDYQLPPLSLLNPPRRSQHKMSHDEIHEFSDTIVRTLRDFGIETQVTHVTQGPVVTRFEVKPAPGIPVKRIATYQSDLAMALRAMKVRIQIPIPGKAAVGIEVPNPKPNFVFFSEIAACEEFRDHPSPLAFILGKRLTGEPCVLDLASMPHLLIAGATGSGKSVCLNSLICSILFRQPPDRVKLMLIDPKKVEFRFYDAIPHLISPVVTDLRRAPSALAWLVEHMEERYNLLAEVGVRDIDMYNQLVESDQPEAKAMGHHLKYMPPVIVVVDELGDLMAVAKADVEESILRIAQKARAVGIHLVIATQRPVVKVVTGVIKANLPARIAFRVRQKNDSEVILDEYGARELIGNGDLLFSTGSAEGLQRMQGALIADDEVERLCEFILEQERAVYIKTDFQPKRSKGKGDADEPIGGDDDDGDGEFDDDLELSGDLAPEDGRVDDHLRRAIVLVLKNRKASVSLIQRRMKIGFARAGRLMDQMEAAGIVGPYQGSKPREILVDPAEYLRKMEGGDEAA
ncbi:DNA translocase FtsK [Candidatus Sumerlaeota bacterium]|nr:DNA translocase FtsK [Candidatus Sumerlaeota bacterium]